MGKAWARALHKSQDVALVGWMDLDRDRVEDAVRELGLDRVAVDVNLETALERLEPDLVVDVAVPEAHLEITVSCLERQVPVLGEKPMAPTLGEARELLACSERTGTLFVVSQNRRYNAGLASFQALIAKHLGEVGQLNAEFYRAPHFGGFRDEMASPLLVDMAIHTFDAARYLVGADPLSVNCSEFNPPWSWYRGNASALADFEFTGGLHFSYQGSWCAQGLETSWDAAWRAVGSSGTATWDGTGDPMAEIVLGPDQQVQTVVGAPVSLPGSGIDGSLADFLGALAGGPIPMGECHDNIKSLAMVMAALESSREGRRVAVPI
jgi:predicted dehydrogenase